MSQDDVPPRRSIATPVTNLPALPARPPAGHKGTFGRVIIVAGSTGMSGAAILAGLGALRGGAGLVTLAVPESILPIVAAAEPSYLTRPLPADRAGRIARSSLELLLPQLEDCQALAIGPGLGRGPELNELVGELYRVAPCPLVIDADGLNALAELEPARLEAAGPRVLTPHPGEFSRLSGLPPEGIARDRSSATIDLARQLRATVVLKGAGSVVSDGDSIFINSSGNSGMATGGSGDVLTGLIAALLAQGMPAFPAAQLGVHLHGLAGDLAAGELSQPALIASDLPRYLPAAWRALGSSCG